MAAHLTVEEESIEGERQHNDRDLLPLGVRAVTPDQGRQGKGQRGENDQQGEIGGGAGAVVAQVPVLDGPDEQREPDHRIENDH